MSMYMWAEFYEKAYAYLRENPLPVCGYGVECGWRCCASIDAKKRRRVNLPYEDMWQRENQSQLVGLPAGCDKCGLVKSVLCSTWPFFPFPTPEGHDLVVLMMACEGPAMDREMVKRSLQFVKYLCVLMTPPGRLSALRHQFVQEMATQAFDAEAPSLVASVQAMTNMLAEPDAPSLLKAVMDAHGSLTEFGESFRRLPVLKVEGT